MTINVPPALNPNAIPYSYHAVTILFARIAQRVLLPVRSARHQSSRTSGSTSDILMHLNYNTKIRA